MSFWRQQQRQDDTILQRFDRVDEMLARIEERIETAMTQQQDFYQQTQDALNRIQANETTLGTEISGLMDQIKSATTDPRIQAIASQAQQLATGSDTLVTQAGGQQPAPSPTPPPSTS